MGYPWTLMFCNVLAFCYIGLRYWNAAVLGARFQLQTSHARAKSALYPGWQNMNAYQAHLHEAIACDALFISYNATDKEQYMHTPHCAVLGGRFQCDSAPWTFILSLRR